MDKKTTMENYVRTAFEKGAFNGVWLFAENGEIVSKGAIGWRDAEDRLPLREDSIFDVASISKQFTAAALMLLRREGLLELDDEITRFYPEIPYKGVTIRQLLLHTSGLPDYMNWVEKVAKEEKRIPGNEIILRFLCESGEKALFMPGERWAYCNTGYCLLALIVEKLSGLPFDDFMQNSVFAAAGMHNTRILHRRKDRLTVDNLAYGLVVEGGRYLLPEDSIERTNAVELDGGSGDGNVHTNIFDLLTWDRVLREETLLTKEEQMLMYTPGRLNNGEIAGTEKEKDGYGLGWGILKDPELGLVVDHIAGWAGYIAWYERFVDVNKVLIYLCSREPADTRAYAAFRIGMEAIVRDEEPRPVLGLEELTVQDSNHSNWEELCGSYEWKDEQIELYLQDGELYLRFRGAWGIGASSRLYPLGEKRFGVKEYSGDFVFGENCLCFLGVTGKKL